MWRSPLPVRVVARLAVGGSSIIRCRRQRSGAHGDGRGSRVPLWTSSASYSISLLPLYSTDQSFIAFQRNESIMSLQIWFMGGTADRVCESVVVLQIGFMSLWWHCKSGLWVCSGTANRVCDSIVSLQLGFMILWWHCKSGL